MSKTKKQKRNEYSMFPAAAPDDPIYKSGYILLRPVYKMDRKPAIDSDDEPIDVVVDKKYTE